MRLLAMVLGAASLAWAQLPATAPTVSGAPEILTELETKLDAKKAKVGDAVKLRLLQALLAKGKVAIPEGATLVGQVTEVVGRTDTLRESRLAVRIERAEWKNNSVPFDAMIVRHAKLVRKIVTQPPGRRTGDSRDLDMMAAMSAASARQSQQQQAAARAAASAPTSTPAPKAPSSPPTQPAPSPTPPTAQPQPQPTSSAPVVPVAPPESLAAIKNKVDAHYDPYSLRAEGPHAVDVAVRPSLNPTIGTEFISASRDVLIPKGTLIVLQQRPVKQH